MSNIFDIITKPGDKLELSVTSTLRKVIKMKIGDVILSATQYPSGRIVETRSYMPKSKDALHLLELFDK